MGTHSIEVMILGTAQDGGIPHFGCDCLHCQTAWEDDSKRRLVASLGIIDHEAEEYWLVDASPDIGQQMNLLLSNYPSYRFAGILLTHAHIGHYLGLAFLGRESLNTRDVPVLCTERMANYLRTNQPWKQLVELGNIALLIVEPGNPIGLGSTATATPILVPHRDELSDTVAFIIAGPTKQLIYCPDIDRWEGQILETIKDADIALLDGTFYSADELPDCDISETPHPSIPHSVKRFEGWEAEIRFIHLNHTNRLLSDEGLSAELKRQGFNLGKRGDVWKL
jgi:pyrroloquinoline quinone biosynthesis protein B